VAVDPKSFASESLTDYVEKALEAMKDDLQEKDWGIIGSLRKLAAYYDETGLRMRALEIEEDVDPKDRIRAMELHNKAVYTIPQIISGLDKLGGSIQARKNLGMTDGGKPKSGLQALRGGRAS
jgi:hypothetical protein